MQANLRKALVAVALITPAPSAFADVIADWNEKAIAFVTPRMTPPAAQRVVAMVQVAMFDAINSIERRYRPYLAQLPTPATASKDAAAAAAAGSVLAGLHPQAQAELKDATTAYLSNIPDGDAKSQGISLGEAVAAKILEARAKDGADAADAYRPKTKPGVYVTTPMVVASMWPNVRPFAMTSPSQFRPEPPIALTSEQWANDYNEIRELGGRASSKRTAKQTEDARFWLITGPQATDPVARQLVAVKGMDLVDSARFMALAAVALADAYIAVMDAKYHYDFWRPITAIRNGDTDDNPATERDATWQPIDSTPRNIPAHTASAVRPWPPWARRYSAQPTYRKLPSPAPPPRASRIDGPIFTPMPTRWRMPASGRVSITGSRSASGRTWDARSANTSSTT